MYRYSLLIIFTSLTADLSAQPGNDVSVTEVDSGWARNSVNTVIFRKNSIVTWKDSQYIAFYNPGQFVVLGKRRSGESHWQLRQTPYRGNAADAHNSISIMTDGDGYLHISWDHHGNPLNYCRSLSPGSLELTGKLSMTGVNEQQVTYPEFYQLAGGNLLFLYRDGASGRGNLVVNRYDIQTKKWTQLHTSLIDGEGQRNAYWQACTDLKGTIHLSWVWRESPDVASNHDMCYARSTDGGITWTKSSGKKYKLPITLATAEYACIIPQGSELINQTSICADATGNPYIATYWREKEDSIPQYRLIYKKGKRWARGQIALRTTSFSLSGAGTKSIPISRPQILAQTSGKLSRVIVIFRDAERGNKVSVAIGSYWGLSLWGMGDLYEEQVGSWEPSYDTELWKQKGILNLFVQKTEQVDAEGKSNLAPQMVRVLEWTPR